MKHVRIILVLVALAEYLALFYLAHLPTLEDKTGEPWLRIDLLSFRLLLLPEAVLAWFGEPPAAAILDRLPVLLLAAAILGWTTCAGWLLMVAVRADRGLSRLETFVFATAIGLTTIGTYALAVGLAGWLGAAWVFVVPAAATGGAAARLYRRRRRGLCGADASPASNARPDQDARDSLALSPRWLWAGLPFVLIVVLGAMLPPTDFDVREYHLQAPKEFFQQGQITFLPHNVYANMPLGAEVFALVAMVVTGDWWLGALVGKTVIAAMTPLAALALLAAGRRFFSPSAGIVAAVVYVSIPWIVQVSAAGLVEGALAYYLLLAVYAVMLWNERQEEPGRFSRLALAGYLAGGAAAIKYPAVLFVVTPLAVCIVFREIARPALRAGYCLRSASASLGVFLLAVVLGCGLWYGKNAVLAGNPTYPLFYGVFGGQSWTPAKDAQWNRVHRPHDFSPAALAADLGKVGWRSEWLSPLPVPLAALAFLDWRRRRRLMLWLLAYFGFVIASWWLLTHRIDRFWLPAAVVLSLLAGAGGCWCGERWWRRVFLVLLCLGLGANFLTADTLVYSRYFVPLARLRHDRERVSEPHLYLNSGISGGRVLAVGDAEVFDIEVPVLYNTCFDTCLFEEIVRGRTPESIREELARRGITHVYVHWGEIDRYRRTYGFTDFVDRGVFRGLVAQGILEPVRLFARPDAREPSAVVYRVRRP